MRCSRDPSSTSFMYFCKSNGAMMATITAAISAQQLNYRNIKEPYFGKISHFVHKFVILLLQFKVFNAQFTMFTLQLIMLICQISMFSTTKKRVHHIHVHTISQPAKSNKV